MFKNLTARCCEKKLAVLKKENLKVLVSLILVHLHCGFFFTSLEIKRIL